MSNRLKEIADQADIIANGYSFTRQGELVRILNLNNPDIASVMRLDGEVLETSMM